MREHVIQITNLTKEYGELKAVDNVTLNIERGEIFGLIGPNGAGKTTTINILVGLSLPTSGTVKIAGLDVTKHPIGIRKRLGIGELPVTNLPILIIIIDTDFTDLHRCYC